jgi:membrane-bound lytic murein transglycosylase D
MAGLTVKELHALNPGYNRWATDPNGPYNLLLPIDKVEKFSTELAKTDSSQRLNWVRHKVKSGDSLLKLASKYHTNTDIISKVNELKSNMIIAGNYLIIPVALKSLDTYSLSQDQRLAKTQSKKSGEYKLNHTVKSGDTFWDLSREYKVNLRQLAKWNGMAPTDMLRPGKKLVVWVDDVGKGQRKDAVMRTLTYTVRNGDSLARIAGKFNVKVSDIQKWNQAKLKKYLQPGQRLKIFVDVTRT